MKSRQRFDISGHLSGDELLKYHKRHLPENEMNLIGEHLKGCDLCSDALKGVAEMNNALSIVNIIHDLKISMHQKFTPKKKILYRFELITILLTFFVIGVILFIAYYFLLFKH